MGLRGNRAAVYARLVTRRRGGGIASLDRHERDLAGRYEPETLASQLFEMRRVAQIVQPSLQSVVLQLQLMNLLCKPLLLGTLFEVGARRRDGEDRGNEHDEGQDVRRAASAACPSSAFPLGLRRGKSPWPVRSWRPATTRWSPRQERAARKARRLAELLLDPQELVVLRHAIRAARRAGLDLPAFVATARSAIVVSSVSPLR